MVTREERRNGLRQRLGRVLRFDGLWWRAFARLGCVYGPDWWKRYSPPLIAAICFALVGSTRRGVIANLRHVLGPRGWWRERRDALRTFVEFAHCFTETQEAFGPRPAPVEILPPENDHLASALAEGKGVIILTAHFGNADIASLGLARYERPITMVMAREANPTVWPLIESTHEPRFRVVYDSQSPLRSVTLLRALRENEIVGIQFDSHPLAPAETAVDFFGRPAGFHLGPFLLARASGAAVVPVFVLRLGRRRYAIHALGRYDPRTTQEATQAMERVVRDFERFVRRFPHQWFQFTDYWTPAPGAQVLRGPATRRPLQASAERKERPARRVAAD